MEVVKILKEAGATVGKTNHYSHEKEVVICESQPENGHVLFAAADGHLNELIRINASGHSLTTGDYDGRTALHLAASNGHSKIVKYLISQAEKLNEESRAIWLAEDRYGNRPIDDAMREGHTLCQELLENAAILNESASLGSYRKSSGFTLETK